MTDETNQLGGQADLANGSSPPDLQSNIANQNLSSINAITVKLPPFWPDDPETYFNQAESCFRTSGVTTQRTKYDHVVMKLPCEIAKKMRDVIRTCTPLSHQTPYDTLRDALISRNTVSESVRIERLLAGEQMGDRSPSNFYRDLMSDVGSISSVSEPLVRTFWMRALPSSVEMTLQALKEEPIDTILRVADNAYDVSLRQKSVSEIKQPRSQPSEYYQNLEHEISALKEMIMELRTNRQPRSRNRSQSRPRGNRNNSSQGKLCFYHYRFGDDAKNCREGCPHYQKFSSKN